jgi:hypothetical protein
MLKACTRLQATLKPDSKPGRWVTSNRLNPMRLILAIAPSEPNRPPAREIATVKSADRFTPWLLGNAPLAAPLNNL